MIWTLGNISLSISNLGRIFYGLLGKEFWGPIMERELIVSHGWLAAMLPPKVKFNRGDGIKANAGFVLGGSGGPKSPSWVSEKSKNVGSSSWKYVRFQNSGSSEVSKWDISIMGRRIS